MTMLSGRWTHRMFAGVIVATTAGLLPASFARAEPTVPLLKPAMTFSQHTSGVNGVALAPDGRTAATASSDKTIRFWDMMSGARTGIIRHTDPVTAIAYTPDGRT